MLIIVIVCSIGCEVMSGGVCYYVESYAMIVVGVKWIIVITG